MSVEYFFDEKFAINANASLFAQNTTPVTLNAYDYIFTLAGDLNDYFNTRTYQQNANSGNGMNVVDVDLQLNKDFFNGATAYNSTNFSSGNGCLSTGFLTTTDMNTRVLEVLAMKIFGHARARAAISNDTDLIAPIKSNLANHIQNVLNEHKHDIFNQYVQTDNPNLNANDVNVTQNFNFATDVLSFPGYIVGQLVAEDGTTVLSGELNNGPSVGGNQLVNGLYNVPILIRIGTSA